MSRPVMNYGCPCGYITSGTLENPFPIRCDDCGKSADETAWPTDKDGKPLAIPMRTTFNSMAAPTGEVSS